MSQAQPGWAPGAITLLSWHGIMAHEQLCWSDYRVLGPVLHRLNPFRYSGSSYQAWSYFIKEESSKMTFNHKLTLTALDDTSQLIQNCR